MHEPRDSRRQDGRGKPHDEERDAGNDTEPDQPSEDAFAVHGILRWAFKGMKVATREAGECRDQKVSLFPHPHNRIYRPVPGLTGAHTIGLADGSRPRRGGAGGPGTAMLTNQLLLLQERFDAVVARRPRPIDEPSPARERALGRHHDDFLESDPAHRQRHYDRTRAPSEHLDYYRDLRSRLGTAGVPVVDAPIDLGEFQDWLDRYAILGRFYRRFGEMRIEKCLEHYIVARELRLRRGDTYVDVASAGSPWARVLRRRGVEAYRLDLIYRPGIRGINIGGDATATDLPAGFARAVSIQCAFELFFGETDWQFLEETARVLVPGGRAAITPTLPRRHPLRPPQPGCAPATRLRGAGRRPDLARRRVQGSLLAPLLSRGLRRPDCLAAAGEAHRPRGLRVEPGRGHGGLPGPEDLLVLHVRAR